MIREHDPRRSHWGIVLADDKAPERLPHGALDLRSVPVQYSCLGGRRTLLHRALYRAASIAPTSQILVTALEEHRARWEPILWCIRPERRFIGDANGASLLTSAGAILSIAGMAPSSIVTVLPARCYVAHEWILRDSLRRVAADLPHIPEGAATLGMLDIDDGVDEDYLVVSRGRSGRGLTAQGMARRPAAWVARHLKRQGALVSSGIMIGYAGVFAAHISKHWPEVRQRLEVLAAKSRATHAECEPHRLQDDIPGPVLKSLRWHPPAFPQRVITVSDCGWSGLKSPHAVAKIAGFVAKRTDGDDRCSTPASDAGQGETMAL